MTPGQVAVSIAALFAVLSLIAIILRNGYQGIEGRAYDVLYAMWVAMLWASFLAPTVFVAVQWYKDSRGTTDDAILWFAATCATLVVTVIGAFFVSAYPQDVRSPSQFGTSTQKF